MCGSRKRLSKLEIYTRLLRIAFKHADKIAPSKESMSIFSSLIFPTNTFSKCTNGDGILDPVPIPHGLYIQ